MRLLGPQGQIMKRAILIMGFVELLKKRAKENIKTIVLPETEDMRTLEATDKILKEGVAKIVLIGNEETIKAKAAEGGFDISGVTIVDPETSDRTQAYIDKFVELRAKKGMTPEKAKEILHTQYPYYGVMMVKMGDADGMVSGATPLHSRYSSSLPSDPEDKTRNQAGIRILPDRSSELRVWCKRRVCICRFRFEPESDTGRAFCNRCFLRRVLPASCTGRADRCNAFSLHQGQRKACRRRQNGRGYKNCKEEHPELKLDGDSSLTQLSYQALALPKLQAAKLQVKQTFLYSRISMQETLAISLRSVLRKQKLTDLLPRVLQNRSTTFPAGCSADEDIVGVVAITAVQCQAEDK